MADTATGLAPNGDVSSVAEKTLDERISAYAPGESMTVDVFSVEGLPSTPPTLCCDFDNDEWTQRDRTPDIFLVGQRPPSAEIRTGPQAVAHEGCVSCSVQCAATFILRATRSATITQPRYVFPEGIVGITDASTTRRPSTPSTRQSASSTDPIGHVLVMWP